MKKLGLIYDESLNISEKTTPEYYGCVRDLFESEEVQSLATFPQHDFINRLRHVVSVSYMSYCLCKVRSLDYRTAARAGLLHDLYYYDWHENDWSHRPHGYRHPGFAVKNAAELCGGELDKLTFNIIKRHMWPLTVIPPKYKESYVVCFADKYCARKEYQACKEQKKNKKMK